MFKEGIKKTKLIIKDAKFGEVYDLVPHLRIDDIKECEAAGYTALKALKHSFRDSFIKRIIYKGKQPLGMFGASYTDNTQKIVAIWFLGTEDIEKYPIFFIKEGKKFVKEILNRNLSIFNYVWTGNKTHIEYIKHIGCEVEENNPVYINNGYFYPFHKFKGEWNV